MQFRKIVLDISVFVCGALVMVFEIIGSRILSPFVGTSTYIWTSLIGVILASLSLGYWLGGRTADKRPDVRILSGIIFAAGGLISATVLAKDIVLSKIGVLQAGLEVKGLVASLLLFAPASLCLGFVTPFAVRLSITTIDHTGRTVGRLYALSTIGSIVGTFTAGFFLIPFVGSVRTLYLIAVCLFAVALSLAPLKFSTANIAAALLLLIGILATEINTNTLRTISGVYDVDTEYSRVQIFTTKDPESERPIKALATDPFFVQSAMFLENDDLVLDYSHFYHLIGHFKPNLEKTLIFGGAGYSFPKDYVRTYPQATIDVVEIDPGMTLISREHFRLQPHPRIDIFHEDGRMFLNHAPTAMYDVVLMDAFGSLFSVPYQLTTIEAVRSISRILKNDGLVVFNMGSSITGDSSRFLEAELNTYRRVFPQVYLFKVKTEYDDSRLQNLITVASLSKVPLQLTSNSPKFADLLSHRYTAEMVSSDSILTDDLAPVEYYNSIAQRVFMTQR